MQAVPPAGEMGLRLHEREGAVEGEARRRRVLADRPSGRSGDVQAGTGRGNPDAGYVDHSGRRAEPAGVHQLLASDGPVGESGRRAGGIHVHFFARRRAVAHGSQRVACRDRALGDAGRHFDGDDRQGDEPIGEAAEVRAVSGAPVSHGPVFARPVGHARDVSDGGVLPDGQCGRGMVRDTEPRWRPVETVARGAGLGPWGDWFRGVAGGILRSGGMVKPRGGVEGQTRPTGRRVRASSLWQSGRGERGGGAIDRGGAIAQGDARSREEPRVYGRPGKAERHGGREAAAIERACEACAAPGARGAHDTRSC